MWPENWPNSWHSGKKKNAFFRFFSSTKYVMNFRHQLPIKSIEITKKNVGELKSWIAQAAANPQILFLDNLHILLAGEAPAEVFMDLPTGNNLFIIGTLRQSAGIAAQSGSSNNTTVLQVQYGFRYDR